MTMEYTKTGIRHQVTLYNIGSGWIDYSRDSSDLERTRDNPDGTQYRYMPNTGTWSYPPQVTEDENWDYSEVLHWFPSRGGFNSHNSPGWNPKPHARAKPRPLTPEQMRRQDWIGATLLFLALIAILVGGGNTG